MYTINGKRWGKKLLFVLILGILMLGTTFFTENNNLSLSAFSFNSPDFQELSKIRIANQDYTVTYSSGNNIYLLSDSLYSEPLTMEETYDIGLDAYSTTLGAVAKQTFFSKIDCPSWADISRYIVDNHLDERINRVNRDWWLGTVFGKSHLARFMTPENRMDAPVEFKEAYVTDQDTCDIRTRTEYGVKPATQFKDPNSFTPIETISGTFKIEITTATSNSFNVFSDYECKVPVMTSKTGKTPAAMTMMRNISKSKTFTLKDGKLVTNGLTTADIHAASAYLAGNGRKHLVSVPIGNTSANSIVLSTGCTSYENITATGYLPATTTSWSSSTIGSTTYKSGNNITYANILERNFNRPLTTCEGVVHEPEVSYLRPIIRTTVDQFVWAGSSKRTFSVEPKFLRPFPSNTGSKYVSVKSDAIDVMLTPDAEGVASNVIEVPRTKNGRVKIPLTLTGAKEGTQYISAIMNIDGEDRYAVLKETTGDQEIVELDFSNIANIDTTNSLNLTLYVEDAGIGDTTYMSQGTPITIKLIDKQLIAFDEGQETSLTYGDTMTLTASLISMDDKQANTDIEYSIEGDNGEIVSQSYQKDNGTATAQIRATSGTGDITIKITKAGEDTIIAASEQTYTITQTPKAITVHPTFVDKIYNIGEQMPSFLPSSDGLINNDTLPDTLIPILEPLEDSPAQPDQDGNITEIGSWKLIYPVGILDSFPDITKKYDITLVDYQTDSSYYFETGIDAIDSGWILVEPLPNDQGWNKEQVEVKPSEAAIKAGYTVLEVVNGNNVIKSGNTIIYDSETDFSGITPTIRLRKGTFTTDPVSIRTIKLDLTDPSLKVAVDQETNWAKEKTILIDASDSLSGISSVEVHHKDGTAFETKLQNDQYSFIATKNGEYIITASDCAGNRTELKKDIQKIDATAVSLEANKEEFAPDEQRPKQKVTLTYEAGASGVKSLKIYFKKQKTGEYQFYKELEATQSPIEWYAEMNGWFQFELINQAGSSATAEIETTQINPPKPVTQINAVYEDNNTITYVPNTWTKHNVVISVKNVNDEVDGDVSWQYRKTSNQTWTELIDDTLTIQTDSTITETVEFKGILKKEGHEDVEEESIKTITVKIDQTKPAEPVLKDPQNYTENKWYSKAVTLELTVPEKSITKLNQRIYVCQGTKDQCESASSTWNETASGKTEISGNGRYELYFKTIDEAGNESVLSNAAYVNINNEKPKITIKLKNNPLKSFINELTFGIFFNETVDMDIEVDYGEGQGGSVYYIIDQNDSGKPADDDPNWTKDTHASLSSDMKAFIYVKAVSDANVIERADSIFDVYIDTQPPNITMPNQMDQWSNTNAIQVSIADETSGLNPDSLQIKIKDQEAQKFKIKNGTATIKDLPNGAYDIAVSASDHSGNQASAKTAVKIDTEIPVIQSVLAETNTWETEKSVIIDAEDRLSGIKEVSVVSPNGTNINVTKQENEAYSFTSTQNGTYVVHVEDQAGNESTYSYVEAKIDTEAPLIEQIVIDSEHEWKSSKKVSFDVIEKQSGIDQVLVSYIKDGATKNVNATMQTNDKTYYFTAKEAAEYTITVRDLVGNTTTEKINIENIDANGLKILNISDYVSWTKDSKTISFEIQAGASGLTDGFPKVFNSSDECTVTKQQNQYSFTATKNGTYSIQVKNNAGDEEEEQIIISTIDSYAPVIESVSSNHTDTIWRKPQTITFHAFDYNDIDHTAYGSGLKESSPVVTINKNGALEYIEVTQDDNDVSLYSFIADQNTTYTISVQDVVEHPTVTQEVVVDHIIEDSMISDLKVKAYHNGELLASGTWVSGEIQFEIAGGLDDSVRASYEVAITDGTIPDDAAWEPINKGKNKHIVNADTNGDVYWFRAQPNISKQNISTPFTVCIDSLPPDKPKIVVTPVHDSMFAKMIHLLSFGNWMKERQEVTVTSHDNMTSDSQLTYQYAEEVDGVIGEWKEFDGSLTYEDHDIILHVKAYDLAGNDSEQEVASIQIDTIPPQIQGVLDQREYKQYYSPRYITVSDDGSGLDTATYKKNNMAAGTFIENEELGIKGEGTYEIYAVDHAGNEVTLTFKIVKLPNIETEIDGSDESRDIIDQIIKEYEEVKDKIEQSEKDEYEHWTEEAEKKWDSLRMKVVKDKETTSKVEGQGDITFDPKTELVVKEIPKDQVPVLPKHAIKTYDVYLMKEKEPVQPDGNVKVYLPYEGSEQPIVYEISEDGTVKQLDVKQEAGYVTFVTTVLKKYAISNTAQSDTSGGNEPTPDDPTKGDQVCVIGPDQKPNTNDDVCGKGNGTKDPEKKPDGTIEIPEGGTVIFPDGSEVVLPDGGTLKPDGSVTTPDGTEYEPDGTKKEPMPEKEICVIGPDQKPNTNDDVCGKGNGTKDPEKKPDGTIEIPEGGTVIFPDGSEVVLPDGGTLKPDGSVTTPDGTEYEPDGTKKEPKPEKEICVIGPDQKPNTNDDVCGKGNGTKDPEKKPDGTIEVPDGGKVVFPDKEIDAPDGAIINPDGSVDFPDGTHFDPDGNETKKPDSKPDPDDDETPAPDNPKPNPQCQLKGGETLNTDSDTDGLPDLNLDIDQDCVADLNIDINKDGIPDLNIDTDGDGQADINIDRNEDGYAELNIKKLTKWTPDKDCEYDGFQYDTMGGLEADLNIDSDGDGVPDRNVDTNGDGTPDVNVDEDWFIKRGIKDPRTKSPAAQSSYTQNTGGASTSDSSKWMIWWTILGMTITSMGYSVYKNRHRQR